MSDIDAKVNAWLLKKYRAEARSRGWQAHLAACPTTVVKVADMGWECDCYSDYTRDDRFTFTAKLRCEHGEEAGWSYGSWSNLPDFIDELGSYADSDCPYREDDE
ncbi:hypothetical protein [Streptomyces sp. URMC 129]|uniref:hypothetical protein n=1 Tax=Streptomyces sp. URMC 129 TaxID=3423407 RepID=UPI003F1BCCBE